MLRSDAAAVLLESGFVESYARHFVAAALHDEHAVHLELRGAWPRRNAASLEAEALLLLAAHAPSVRLAILSNAALDALLRDERFAARHPAWHLAWTAVRHWPDADASALVDAVQTQLNESVTPTRLDSDPLHCARVLEWQAALLLIASEQGKPANKWRDAVQHVATAAQKHAATILVAQEADDADNDDEHESSADADTTDVKTKNRRRAMWRRLQFASKAVRESGVAGHATSTSSKAD